MALRINDIAPDFSDVTEGASTTRGAQCFGTPRKRSYGSSAPSSSEATRRLASIATTRLNPRTLETSTRDRRHCQHRNAEAGVFAEGAARAVAASLVARISGKGEGQLYGGAGSCYIEFGGERVGRVDVDLFGPKPTGVYHEPSLALRADKNASGASRRVRWFGV